MRLGVWIALRRERLGGGAFWVEVVGGDSGLPPTLNSWCEDRCSARGGRAVIPCAHKYFLVTGAAST